MSRSSLPLRARFAPRSGATHATRPLKNWVTSAGMRTGTHRSGRCRHAETDAVAYSGDRIDALWVRSARTGVRNLVRCATRGRRVSWAALVRTGYRRFAVGNAGTWAKMTTNVRPTAGTGAVLDPLPDPQPEPPPEPIPDPLPDPERPTPQPESPGPSTVAAWFLQHRVSAKSLSR